MKTFTLVTLTAMTLMLSGCKDESVDFGGNGDGGDPQTETGYLVMSAMSVTVADDAEVIPYSNGTKAAMTRAAGSVSEAPDNYKVSIRNAKTGEQTNHVYADLKKAENQRMPLTPGSYTVSAESPDYADYMAGTTYADWEKPVYAGSVTKSVIKNNETTVDDLVCTLANIRTTVTLTQDLQKLFMSDADAEAAGKEKLAVTLSIGDNALVFDREAANAGKAGYFKAVETANTLKILLSGQYNKAPGDATPEYVTVNWSKEITNCKAGQWRKITINVLNANEGNVQFQITVENWVYDQKIDVDVMRLYAFAEETIPDEDISDEGSPVVTLDGKDIAQGYTISGSMYDELLGKWTENLKAVVTPEDGATVKSVNLVFESDNADFLAAVDAAGYKNRTVPLWPENEANAPYVVMKEASTSVLTATVKDAGMSGFYQYEGTHTAKFVTVDSKGRTSYTKLNIRVTESGSTESGPGIVWTNKSGSKTYDFDTRYNHIGMEILIGVTSQTGFTGFTVDIISENVLPASELESVGLASHLDLINPGEFSVQTGRIRIPDRSGRVRTENVVVRHLRIYGSAVAAEQGRQLRLPSDGHRCVGHQYEDYPTVCNEKLTGQRYEDEKTYQSRHRVDFLPGAGTGIVR